MGLSNKVGTERAKLLLPMPTNLREFQMLLWVYVDWMSTKNTTRESQFRQLT